MTVRREHGERGEGDRGRGLQDAADEEAACDAIELEGDVPPRILRQHARARERAHRAAIADRHHKLTGGAARELEGARRAAAHEEQWLRGADGIRRFHPATKGQVWRIGEAAIQHSVIVHTIEAQHGRAEARVCGPRRSTAQDRMQCAKFIPPILPARLRRAIAGDEPAGLAQRLRIKGIPPIAPRHVAEVDATAHRRAHRVIVIEDRRAADRASGKRERAAADHGIVRHRRALDPRVAADQRASAHDRSADEMRAIPDARLAFHQRVTFHERRAAHDRAALDRRRTLHDRVILDARIAQHAGGAEHFRIRTDIGGGRGGRAGSQHAAAIRMRAEAGGIRDGVAIRCGRGIDQSHLVAVAQAVGVFVHGLRIAEAVEVQRHAIGRRGDDEKDLRLAGIERKALRARRPHRRVAHGVARRDRRETPAPVFARAGFVETAEFRGDRRPCGRGEIVHLVGPAVRRPHRRHAPPAGLVLLGDQLRALLPEVLQAGSDGAPMLRAQSGLFHKVEHRPALAAFAGDVFHRLTHRQHCG